MNPFFTLVVFLFCFHFAFAMPPDASMDIGDRQCTTGDIRIESSQTSPLPNHIPTYTVQVLNVCANTNSSFKDIHLKCGWYSSAILVDPKIFRRLKFDDCLLNDGQPVPSGLSVSFEYANTYAYQFSVLSASLIPA